MLTWLCRAAVRRIPGSLGRSSCVSVVITQRAQLRALPSTAATLWSFVAIAIFCLFQRHQSRRPEIPVGQPLPPTAPLTEICCAGWGYPPALLQDLGSG